MSKYIKLDTPISVGACYPQGSNYVSWYKVLSIDDDTAILCRPKDGWTLVAHNPALYETPHGQQLIWDYSTGGHFEKTTTKAIKMTFKKPKRPTGRPLIAGRSVLMR